MKMRNDKDFRKNCEILANDIVEESMAWRSSLEEPQDWHCRIDNFGHLQAAALLYIAANMPNPEDLEITVDNTETGESSFVNINYCPFCGRAL